MKMNVVSIIGIGFTVVGGIISAIGSSIDMNKTIAEEVAKAMANLNK